MAVDAVFTRTVQLPSRPHTPLFSASTILGVRDNASSCEESILSLHADDVAGIAPGNSSLRSS